MPAAPQNMISDVTELILDYIRQSSPELQVTPNLDKNHQTQVQAIEEKITAMKEILTSVQASFNARIVQRKKHWNSLIRFNQLPLEVASNILWLSIVDPWPQNHLISFLERQQTISRVCSSWRTLVEGSPRFWSIIELPCSLAVISHFLDKSRSSGLEIKNFEWIKGLEPFTPMSHLNLIALHAHRIQSLILCSDDLDGLEAFLEKPAPMLEELKIDSLRDAFLKPLNLFCGQASRLQDVALYKLAVPWDSDAFVGLRSLIISATLEYLPTEELMRRLLAANPGLEKMDIEGWSGWDSERFGEDPEHFGENAVQSTGAGKPSRVVMSEMQELRLSQLPFELVQAVLCNVEIPSIRYLEIWCTFREVRASRMLGSNLRHLVPSLLQLSKGAQQVQLTFDRSTVGLAIYTPHRKSPTIQIKLTAIMPISGFDWLAQNFFHPEGLPSVCEAAIFHVSFKMHGGVDLTEDPFIPVLDRLNAIKVKVLNIEDWSHHGKELIDYLGQMKGDSQWPLPYLTSMKIKGPAELANHLSIALQRRMQSAPARETPEVPRPVMLEVLNIGGLRGVDKDTEKALAKCVAASGRFIPGRQKPHPLSDFIDSESDISSDEDI